jgi:hypothetical protein
MQEIATLHPFPTRLPGTTGAAPVASSVTCAGVALQREITFKCEHLPSNCCLICAQQLTAVLLICDVVACLADFQTMGKKKPMPTPPARSTSTSPAKDGDDKDGAARATTDLAEMKREVECPVCLQVCVDPRCLVCLHTVCIQCLQEMPKPLVCPVCQLPTPIPADGVQGLLKNFYIQKLVDMIAITETALQMAGSTDAGAEAPKSPSAPSSVRCSECGETALAIHLSELRMNDAATSFASECTKQCALHHFCSRA